METCHICGKDTLRIWTETYEVFGRIDKEMFEECVNPNCGEESEDDE